MKISFSPASFDIRGGELYTLDERNSAHRALTRRLSRVRTLDTGVLLSDFGFSEGDRSFRVSLSGLTKSELDELTGMIKTHSKFILSLPDGVFSVGVSSYDYRIDLGLAELNCLSEGILN